MGTMGPDGDEAFMIFYSHPIIHTLISKGRQTDTLTIRPYGYLTR